ncbi:MAG TPA: RcpC/CpaB family pilus assembly protein [Acidimicrobiales bacterium]|nr:RcpC/CpaB family pilus assembly protein [Acidimicrobiales bacterium]
MNRRLIGLLVSLALATVGTIVLVGYVRSAEARALEGEQLVEVLVVTDRIEAGTTAADVAGSVRAEEVPAKVRAAGALGDTADLRALEGLVADVDLLPGEQLLRDRFVAPAVVQRGDVPAGLLEVTLSLATERALGGRVSPGETVGVVGSFTDSQGTATTRIILHKVVVTAVQLGVGTTDDIDDENAEFPNSNVLVTLAVDALSAERLVFAAEHGRVWLTSEPLDAPETDSGVQTYETVMS